MTLGDYSGSRHLFLFYEVVLSKVGRSRSAEYAILAESASLLVNRIRKMNANIHSLTTFLPEPMLAGTSLREPRALTMEVRP